MRFYIVVVVALTSFTVGLAFDLFGKSCHNTDDCDPSECCLARGMGIFRKGRCKKLSQEDERCSMEDDMITGMFGHRKYKDNCPCDEGLYCNQEGKRWGIFNKQFCRKSETTEEQEETTAELGTTSTESEGPTTEAEDQQDTEHTEPEEQPVTEPDEQPVTEPEEQPVTEPEEQPVTEPEEQPVTEPEEQPVTESEEQPVTEPEEEFPESVETVADVDESIESEGEETTGGFR